MTFFNFQNSSRESENNVGINSWDSLNKKVINQKPYWLHLKKKKTEYRYWLKIFKIHTGIYSRAAKLVFFSANFWLLKFLHH